MKPIPELLLALCLGITGPALVRAQDPAPAASGPEEADYRIGPEDVLQIQAWGRSDLSGTATVDETGLIRLPMIGDIGAQGRTPMELSRLLTERYQLLDSKVTDVIVSVSAYHSQGVTVVGEVREPGRYGFRSLPDLWTILLTAGGTTPAADLARVQIARREHADGEASVVTVDLSRGIAETAGTALPEVRPRDTVIVPSLIEGTVSGDKFQVLGAVRTPGTYRISAAGRVVEALSACGGALPEADLSNVRVTRPAAAGALSYRLDLRGYLEEGRPAADLPLKPGDTITVPNRSSFLSTVLNQFVRVAPIASLATSLVLLSR